MVVVERNEGTRHDHYQEHRTHPTTQVPENLVGSDHRMGKETHMSGILVYDSNNSGGNWWLTDENWEALAAAGWNVHWAHIPKDFEYDRPVGRCYGDKVLDTVKRDPDVRYLGAAAAGCAKRFDNPAEGVREWEGLTGQSAGAIGCNCCGSPHSFEWRDDNGTSRFVEIYVPDDAEWGFV